MHKESRGLKKKIEVWKWSISNSPYNYDAANRTDFFFLISHWNSTEITLKNIYKGNHIDDNHREMFPLMFKVQGKDKSCKVDFFGVWYFLCDVSFFWRV